MSRRLLVRLNGPAPRGEVILRALLHVHGRIRRMPRHTARRRPVRLANKDAFARNLHAVEVICATVVARCVRCSDRGEEGLHSVVRLRIALPRPQRRTAALRQLLVAYAANAASLREHCVPRARAPASRRSNMLVDSLDASDSESSHAIFSTRI